MNSKQSRMRVRAAALILGTAIFLTGCGGGGGSSNTVASPATAASEPDPVPVTTSGVITGFSSVFVNGDKYEVEPETVVSIEGQAEKLGDDSDLRIGMKVRVHAEEDQDGVRVAERIEYDDDLRGPARNVSPGDDPRFGTFDVLGTTVVVDGMTILDDDIGDNNGDDAIDLRDLALPSGEMIVEVSGLPGVDAIIASRVDRVEGPAGLPGTDGDEFEVKGFVESVAADGRSFIVNGTAFVVVEGAGGTAFEDGLSVGPELVGVFVEVKADDGGGGELIAVLVEREDGIGDRNGDGVVDREDRYGEFEIEGILVAVDTSGDPDEIVISGTTFQVNDATELVHLVGSRVEIGGTFDENGILTLRRVSVEGAHTVRTEDLVEDINLDDGAITTRLGLAIAPTGLSRIEDDLADDDSGDRLTPEEFVSRVQRGDRLEARGIPLEDGSVSWRRVERADDEDVDCELRGPVESVEGSSASAFSFVIQGVTINVDAIGSETDFGGIGRQNFYDNLTVGAIVEAESDEEGLGCQDRTLSARRVEFEGDDDVFGTVSEDVEDGPDEITGTPQSVTQDSFILGDRAIRVVGSTIIDDSLIERALGEEFDGGDKRFDGLPAGLSLPDLLPGTFPVAVVVDAGGVALRIEDV